MLAKNKSILPFLVVAFIIFSWPFFHFPLTDGDVGNWVSASVEIIKNGTIWGGNDQGHGPLMAWMGALSILAFGKSYYMLNFFNMVMGLLGVYFVHFFSQKFFKSNSISQLATLFMVSSIAPVYLSRTPMYDWPAAILYFIFAGAYILYLEEKKMTWLWVSLLSIGICSLLRFSIAIGLAGFFMLWVSFLIYKRPFHLIIRDGLLIILGILLFNLPWIFSQIQLEGNSFLSTFIYDNTGRFVKSTRPNATVRFDFYGFPLYVLLGLLPFTFFAIASFFKKDIIAQVKANKFAHILVAGFLPCLILFSLSGHTKLARYIAYVFPFIFMLLSYLLIEYDLKRESFHRICRRMLIATAVLIGGLLIQQAIQFRTEAQSSFLFVGAAIFLVYGLLATTYFSISHDPDYLRTKASKLLLPLATIYIIFFSVVSYEYHRAPFLKIVDDMIQSPLLRLEDPSNK